jgi:ribosomal protein S18 acetylase RimI-like enzyme
MDTIRQFDTIQARQALPQLIALLRDAVDHGASLGFIPPLDLHLAERYWLDVFQAMENGSRILLVAQRALEFIGTVQLDLCTRQNGLHRAEVQKLLVHTAYRRQGVGEALMRAIEDEARQANRTTLVLDTRVDNPAEKLYVKLGYHRAGIIPEYVRIENDILVATAIYYRLLNS